MGNQRRNGTGSGCNGSEQCCDVAYPAAKTLAATPTSCRSHGKPTTRQRVRERAQPAPSGISNAAVEPATTMLEPRWLEPKWLEPKWLRSINNININNININIDMHLFPKGWP